MRQSINSKNRDYALAGIGVIKDLQFESFQGEGLDLPLGAIDPVRQAIQRANFHPSRP
jgi:hypothetical protein